MLYAFNATHTARFGSGAVILRSKDSPLSDDQLRGAAPSIFQAEAHHSRSERFSYIPTIEVLNGLRREGFMPFEVRQGGSRDAEKRTFTKHMIRLRHASVIGSALAGGDSVRELIMVNAHDGTSSYQLMSGLFRIVCTNGLITCSEGEMMRVAHKGDIIGNVIEGAYQVIENAALVGERVREMQSLQLSAPEQEAFAAAALELRFNQKDEDGEIKKAPVEARQLNKPRRTEDAGNDMWKTFNRVQENVIRGGASYVHRAASGRRSYRETRPVNSIDSNVTINRALWVLTSKMQELKAAA